MYTPKSIFLERYADILVNFALNSGAGVRPKEVVRCVVPDVARPFYGPLQEALLKAKAQPMMRFMATGYDADYFDLANNDQLAFFPKNFVKARLDLIDHMLAILAKRDPHELEKVPPEKIFLATRKNRQIRDWQYEKEVAGKYTWTIGMYGTPMMAEEAGLSIEAYWEQIVRACFLDENDPITKWQEVQTEINRLVKRLNNLAIDRLHVEGEGIDLWMTLGDKRKWLGGGGANIPSYEIYTSPDWRGTEGVVEFNQPLYRYGVMVEGIRLKFEKGRVVEATATKNQKALREMIAQEHADKLGEYSLTDSRLSRITKFMAETMYDENMGGKYGNTHIALGMAYKETFAGEGQKLKNKDWEQLGFNNSAIHCDMITTKDRTVTALLKDGSSKVIYEKGRFTF